MLNSVLNVVRRASAEFTSHASVRSIGKTEPMGTQLSVVSLYSGAGGLDLGFVNAGFDVEWAIDSDFDATETHRANIGGDVVCGALPGVEVPEGCNPDVVIGGPPCQGFSVIGNMNPADPRSNHVFHFLDVVESLRPKAFVMENVKALAIGARWEETRNELLAQARSAGYTTEIYLLNASHFGVPQARERMFMVGVKDGEPIEPSPTTLDDPPTVREAFANIPAFGQPGNDSVCTAKIVPAARPVLRPSAYRGSLMFNGSGRPLALDEPAKTIPASMGGNATPIVDQREIDGSSSTWLEEYHSGLLAGRKPARRTPAHLRRITVEEAAALQSFPADWDFSGQQGSRYRQIGNAVPPLLAEAVAKSVAAALAFNAESDSTTDSMNEADRALVAV